MKSDFRKELKNHGKIIYTNVGDSMEPIIRQNRDVLIISQKPDCRLKKYDVPLYQRDSGQYVLHRILKVKSDSYVLCGDNRWHKENGVSDQQIIGVLTGIIRDGKEISVSDFYYRFYVHLWCDFFVFRAVWLRVKYKLKGMNR